MSSMGVLKRVVACLLQRGNSPNGGIRLAQVASHAAMFARRSAHTARYE